MAHANIPFDKRMRRITKNHHKLSRGTVTEMRADGLMVLRPRRQTSRFIWKPLVFLVVGFFLFKTFVLTSLGAITYDVRLDKLRTGTLLETQAAWVMEIDPATQWLSEFFAPAVPNFR